MKKDIQNRPQQQPAVVEALTREPDFDDNVAVLRVMQAKGLTNEEIKLLMQYDYVFSRYVVEK